MSTYALAAAPKFAGLMTFDCADCGHPELGRPVFLAGPAGTAAYGTGCAARLLEVDVDTLAATVAADTLRAYAAEHAFPEVVAATWAEFSMFLPSRVTAKFVRDTTARVARLDADTLALVTDTYKALAKVGQVRTLRSAELAGR